MNLTYFRREMRENVEKTTQSTSEIYLRTSHPMSC